MKQKISRRTAPPAPELRHCARAARARRGTPRKPHGAVRQSLQVASSAGRADRSVADASHAAARLPGKAASFIVRQSLQLAKASRERTMGGQDAWVTREQSSRDAMAMPGVREVRSRKTILRRDLRNAHTRAFPARTRGVVFSLATVWRRARPSSDPRPPYSRAPPSSFSSPTAAVGAEHGASRGASRVFRVSRSIAAPRAASPPRPRTPSADADIFSAEDSTCANARLRFLSDGSLPTSAVLARARGGHHPRRRVHQAGHGVRRRPARHRRAAQGTSIGRRRADPRPPRARQTPRLRRKRSGCPGDRKTTIRRRRCGGSPRIFSRTKRFLARSVFSSEEETHLASSSPSPQPRPPLIRGSDAAGARSPTPPSARGPPRVSGLRTDRDPPRAPLVSVASLSEPRTRGSFRERRGFSLFLRVRSIRRPTKTQKSEDALVTDDRTRLDSHARSFAAVCRQVRATPGATACASSRATP